MEQISEFDISNSNSAVECYRYAENDVNITECLNMHVDAIFNMHNSLQKMLSFINNIVLPCAENIAREELGKLSEESCLISTISYVSLS